MSAPTLDSLQKIDVKLAVDVSSDFNFDVLLRIFGDWRLEEGEELIDLADYLHVPNGPGCLLVSHLWHLGIDRESGRPGVLLSSRAGLDGSVGDRVKQAVKRALVKAERLLGQDGVKGQVSARPGAIDVVINDRLRAPNTSESDAAFRPALESVLDSLYGASAYSIHRDEDPARRLSYRVEANGEAPALGELAKRLA